MSGETFIESVIKLLRTKGRTFDEWTDDQIVSYVWEYMKRQHAGFVMQKDECIGIGLMRYLSDIDHAENPLFHEPDGKIAWIDVVVTSKPECFSILLEGMKEAISNTGQAVTMVAGKRVRRDGRLFLYDIDRFFNRFPATRMI